MNSENVEKDTNSVDCRKLDICIVAHFAYGALSGGFRGHIGGVERQTSLMARWLAARGHRVSMVTWDEGQRDGVEIEGVRVLKVCRRDEGLPGVRFFHPRWTSLIRALGRADAEIYYQNCGEDVTGQVALWCRAYRRKFVFSVAHDGDCDAQLPILAKRRERMLYRWGIRLADGIIVQTQAQARMLHEGFGRDAEVIPMPCPVPQGEGFREWGPGFSGAARVLWVGRICEMKRPDRFLDLAEAMPEFEFDLVGPPDDTEYSKAVIDRARRTPKVTFHGPVPRDEMAGFYRRSACLCCTSEREGFPNTFLEAWSHGVPVASTFDPDSLIAGRGLGEVAADFCKLEGATRDLLSSPERWQSISDRCREYVMENHAMDRVLPRFERIFLEVLGDSIALGKSSMGGRTGELSRRERLESGTG